MFFTTDIFENLILHISSQKSCLTEQTFANYIISMNITLERARLIPAHRHSRPILVIGLTFNLSLVDKRSLAITVAKASIFIKFQFQQH